MWAGAPVPRSGRARTVAEYPGKQTGRTSCVSKGGRERPREGLRVGRREGARGRRRHSRQASTSPSTATKWEPVWVAASTYTAMRRGGGGWGPGGGERTGGAAMGRRGRRGAAAPDTVTCGGGTNSSRKKGGDLSRRKQVMCTDVHLSFHGLCRDGVPRRGGGTVQRSKAEASDASPDSCGREGTQWGIGTRVVAKAAQGKGRRGRGRFGVRGWVRADGGPLVFGRMRRPSPPAIGPSQVAVEMKIGCTGKGYMK